MAENVAITKEKVLKILEINYKPGEVLPLNNGELEVLQKLDYHPLTMLCRCDNCRGLAVSELVDKERVPAELPHSKLFLNRGFTIKWILCVPCYKKMNKEIDGIQQKYGKYRKEEGWDK